MNFVTDKSLSFHQITICFRLLLVFACLAYLLKSELTLVFSHDVMRMTVGDVTLVYTVFRNRLQSNGEFL